MEKCSRVRERILSVPPVSVPVPIRPNSHRWTGYKSWCGVADLYCSHCEVLTSLKPVIIGVISALLFTCIVMAASFVTTYFMSSFEEPDNDYFSFFFISPFQVAQDLITAAFRILKDGEVDIFQEAVSYTTAKGTARSPIPRRPPGLLQRFVRRFLLGLPLVGAGSIVQLLVSLGGLGPVQWIARFRGSRNRRNNNSRDIAALIVITLVVLGAARLGLSPNCTLTHG
jgi:hypothetical protein